MSEQAALLEQCAALGRFGGFVYDPAGDRFVTCSAGLARLHGLTAESFQALRLDELVERIDPADRAAYRAAFRRLIEDGTGYELAYGVIKTDGRRCNVRECAEPLDGGPRLIGWVQDVTAAGAQLRAAQAAERAARALNARLQGAADAVTSGVAIVDAEGRLAYFNRSYRELSTANLQAVLRLGEHFGELLERAAATAPLYHPDTGGDFAGGRPARAAARQVDQEIRLADGRWLRVRESALADGGRVILTTDITERKAVEAALRESEARLAAFMEHVPVGMELKDLDGRYILVNREFCRFAARSADEFLGRTATDLFTADDADDTRAVEREVAATGRTIVREERFRDRGQWQLVVRFPICGSEGEVTHVGGFHVDITEQKAAAERLQASEQRCRALTEAHPVPLVIVAVDDACILHASPPLAEMVGVSYQELIGASSLRFWAEPADRAAFVDRVRREGGVSAEEVQLRRADGCVFSVAFTSKLISYEGREAIITGVTDLADRRRAEAVDQLLRAVIDAVPGVIHLKDRELRYQLANRYYLEQWGLTAEQLIGSTQQEVFRDQLAFAWSRATDDRDARVLATGRATGFYEVTVPVKGGQQMVLWANKAPLCDDHGAVTHILTVGTDITELKRAEEEIARQRDALHQSEKLSALGSILASVAHELNNPLSVVLGYATLLADLAPDGATEERAERVRVAAERCARIVRTFLAMARQKPDVEAPVHLNRIVEAALEVAAYGLRSGGVEVELALDPDLPEIHGNGDQLTLVVMNLIVNAQQALQSIAGPRHISVRTAAGDGHLELEIADNGPGIPADVAARIFEPFFTTKPQGAGTGIGLSLCHNIVTGHGGDIALTDNRGGGACFTVRLPRRHAKRGPTPRLHPAAKDRHATVLVVDDEAEIRQLLVDVLERHGHTVETAASGREALEVVAARPVDLILSDLRMPDLDGPGLYQALAARHPDLLPRLVFMTGASLAVDLAAFLRRTGTEVIEKPFEPAELVRRVHDWLRP